MEQFTLPLAATLYVMTSEELRSLLEAEFGRGLDFAIVVNPPSSRRLYNSNMILLAHQRSLEIPSSQRVAPSASSFHDRSNSGSLISLSG
jgi:hypothetical protein